MNPTTFYVNCFVFLIQIQKIYTTDNDGRLKKVGIHEDLSADLDEEKYVDTGWIDFNDMENYGLPKSARRPTHKPDKISPKALPDLSEFDYKREWANDMKCLYGAKNYDKLHKIVQSYIQRYVSLFLITSQLQEREIEEENEIIKTVVEIVITAEDLSFLKDYSKNQSGTRSEDDLRHLDAIMGRIIKLKAKSFSEEAWNLSKRLSFTIDLTQFYNFISRKDFGYSVAFILLLGCCYFRVKRLFFVGVNIFLTLEAVFLYLRKNEQAQMENHVRILQRGSIPVDCTPSDMVWYQKVFSIFQGNQCLDYHKSLVRDSVGEISLIECVWETYAYFLVGMPVKTFSSVTKDFAEGVTGYFPPPFNYIFYAIFVIIFLMFFIFAVGPLLGMHIRLSALFGLFSLDYGQRNTRRQERVMEIQTPVQQPIQAAPVNHYYINYIAREPSQAQILDSNVQEARSIPFLEDKAEDIESIVDESIIEKPKAIEEASSSNEDENLEKQMCDQISEELKAKTEKSCECDIHADLQQLKEIVNDLSSSKLDCLTDDLSCDEKG